MIYTDLKTDLHRSILLYGLFVHFQVTLFMSFDDNSSIFNSNSPGSAIHFLLIFTIAKYMTYRLPSFGTSMLIFNESTLVNVYVKGLKFRYSKVVYLNPKSI